MSAQMLLLGLMYIGGMSGSAVGGLKVIRCIVVARVMLHKITSFFRTGAMRSVKIGNKDISYKTQMSVFAFFCIMLFLSLLGTYFLILDHVDPFTSLGVISGSITNAGLLFGGIGSQQSLGFLSNFSKIISILWMLLGRLEFFSLLVLLMPSFWRFKP
jgi:trk system potassium uptake protein TrkH